MYFCFSFHGNFLSGADSTTVNLLNSGDTVSLKVAEFYDASVTGNRVGSTAAKGAVFLSNGYFLALANADSYLMTVSNDDTDDRMPNSDCTVAGFMEVGGCVVANGGQLKARACLARAGHDPQRSHSLFVAVFSTYVCMCVRASLSVLFSSLTPSTASTTTVSYTRTSCSCKPAAWLAPARPRWREACSAACLPVPQWW